MRLAMMKAVPGRWALEENAKVFHELLGRAVACKADLFLTPECWVDGYAAGDEESTPARLRDEVAQNPESSVILSRVASAAAEHRLGICLGFTSLEEGRLYNAAGLWAPTGELLGIYHKTHLQDRDVQFSPGADLPVWSTPWGTLGIMICADRRWPEVARVLRVKGAGLILTPTYGMHHLDNEWWMRTRSYENECFIAFAHPKVAFVTDPGGNIEAKLDTAFPDVLICDVDLSRVSEENHMKDRRPELYRAICEPALKHQ